MLVLSRQRDQTIKIGDNVDVTIVAIKGDRVRVGIAAPPDIPVHRKEVFDEIQSKREKEGASGVLLKGSSSSHHPAAFSGPNAEPMSRVLNKQIRLLENVCKQGSDAASVERYRQLCDEIVALIQ